MIFITPEISIEETEIEEHFIRASGPGGQNVNRVATAVQLRFDAKNSPSLPRKVRDRLMLLAGKRLTEEGILIIAAQRYRSQERNRKDALERLKTLIRRAAEQPKTRRKTYPSKASRQHRLDDKHHRSGIKRKRKAPVEDL